MKVILLEDVRGSGKKDEIIDVKNGYALNFLIPNGKAILANKENLEKLEEKTKRKAKEKEESKENSKHIAEKLKNINLKLEVKSGEDGKLFGTVTAKEISEKLLETENLKIDKKRIILTEKIKTEGTYIVDVKLEEGVTSKLRIIVNGIK